MAEHPELSGSLEVCLGRVDSSIRHLAGRRNVRKTKGEDGLVPVRIGQETRRHGDMDGQSNE